MRNNNPQVAINRRAVASTMPFLRLLLTVAILVFGLPIIAVPSTASAQGSCGATVTVVYGDTLREIAARCNRTIAEILELNPAITNRNLIRVGQVINLPNAGDPTPGVADLAIQPSSGPAGTLLTVTGRNYPATTEVIVGIGEPESEPVTNIRAMSSADGTLRTQVTVPAEAEPNERFVIVAYVPGQGGERATSGEFITTSGQPDEPGAPDANVTVAPQQGPANSVVRLQATGFAPNAPVEIGFGEVESEYDIIAQATTNASGAIDRTVQVPSFVQAGDQYLFVVTPQGSTQDVTSNVFTITGNGQDLNPQVAISPRSGSPGTNVQVAVRGFPANTRFTYGMGVPQGQLLDTFSARTNRNGSAQLTLQVPEVDPGTNLEVVAFVPQQNSVSAISAPFNVTERDSDGSNLFTRTNIYLVALEDGGQSGMEIGCGDSIVPVEVSTEPTIAPLTAALETLFRINERYYGQSGLYNALAQSDLAIDRIDIVDGVASIYLTGQLQVGGVCDEPRVRAQLEETALQYYTVDEVQIFVNGEPLGF